MNLSDLGHAVALREIARNPEYRAFVAAFVCGGLAVALFLAYVAAVVYCLGAYLGLLS
jgi:hypothetical protein